MDGGRPFSPFVFGFFIQAENRAIGSRVLKIGWCRKFNAAADEGLGGFGADIRTAEQADVDVDAAGIPKFGIHPHQRSVFFPNAGVDDDFAGIVAEPAVQHFAHLNVPIENRRLRLL